MSFFSELIDSYKEQMEKHRNRPFQRAVMAASALVSVADGAVSFSERVRLDQILEKLDKLRVYDPHECIDVFNEFAEAIQDNPKTGREKAIEAILAQIGRAPDTAELLVRVCLALSEIDGEIPLVEQIEIVSLCSHLGVEPNRVGLYTSADRPDGGSTDSTS